MITDLTRFYRLLLRNNSDLVSIKDELEICRLYLDLEKLCHNDTLTWDIYKEDGIENFMMCRFTLQPFLENSIHHGISRISSHIHINVSVCYGDDTVIITITDNGCGMTVKQLNDLKKTLKDKKIDYEKHYGIGNVNQRISSPSFGNGNIQIESSIGKGTRITILFDQMEEKDP
jgi:two-component system sensor histidine kinase YesM